MIFNLDVDDDSKNDNNNNNINAAGGFSKISKDDDQCYSAFISAR